MNDATESAMVFDSTCVTEEQLCSTTRQIDGYPIWEYLYYNIFVLSASNSFHLFHAAPNSFLCVSDALSLAPKAF